MLYHGRPASYTDRNPIEHICDAIVRNYLRTVCIIFIDREDRNWKIFLYDKENAN